MGGFGGGDYVCSPPSPTRTDTSTHTPPPSPICRARPACPPLTNLTGESHSQAGQPKGKRPRAQQPRKQQPKDTSRVARARRSTDESPTGARRACRGQTPVTHSSPHHPSPPLPTPHHLSPPLPSRPLSSPPLLTPPHPTQPSPLSPPRCSPAAPLNACADGGNNSKPITLPALGTEGGCAAL